MADEEKDICADGLFTTTEAARLCKFSRTYLYRLIADGVLPYTQIGKHKHIPKRALIAFMKARTKRSEKKEEPDA